MSARYRVIVQMQSPRLTMSRSGLNAGVRARLSEAFAEDTLAAVQGCRSIQQVVVVSADPQAAKTATAAGAKFAQVSAGLGLNPAVDEAHPLARRSGDQMVAALVSDLPALRSEELEEVLSTATRRYRTLHVTDLGNDNGNGTLQVERTDTFVACLVSDLARRRTPRGTPLKALAPGLRADVDTCAGLRVAAYMGVGPATRRTMDDLTRELLAHGDAV